MIDVRSSDQYKKNHIRQSFSIDDFSNTAGFLLSLQID